MGAFASTDAGPCPQLKSSAPPTSASVLLVDDHALLRTGVANIINQEADLHVVAEAGNGVEALEAYDKFRPDVTLLDLRMPVMEGVEVVRRLRERDPRARVIVLTTYDTDEEISRALKAGAKATCSRTFPPTTRRRASATCSPERPISRPPPRPSSPRK